MTIPLHLKALKFCKRASAHKKKFNFDNNNTNSLAWLPIRPDKHMLDKNIKTWREINTV